ncbi:13417_t:CDS:1, partial [Gigaspora rosea]
TIPFTSQSLLQHSQLSDNCFPIYLTITSQTTFPSPTLIQQPFIWQSFSRTTIPSLTLTQQPFARQSLSQTTILSPMLTQQPFN